MSESQLQDRLQKAYRRSSDCPPPEVFLSENLDGLPADERGKLLEHASRCPACTAERKLAAAFEAPVAADDEFNQVDVDAVVAKLVRSRPLATARPPGTFPRRFAWMPVLAVAATLTLVIVGPTLFRSAPTLPQAPSDTLVRGSRLPIVAPVGEVAEFPTELQWEPVAGATRYSVRMLQVDDSVLYEAQTEGPALELPPSALSAMSAAVVYVWQVEAFDAAGTRVAVSESTRFRVRPSAEDSGKDSE